MLEVLMAENAMLKAKLAQFEETKNSSAHLSSTRPGAQAPVSQAAQLTAAYSQRPHACDSAVEMDTLQQDSPPPKRRAQVINSESPSQAAATNSVKHFDDDMLRHFGETLTQTLTETLSAKFGAMLDKFGENIDAQIASLKARVTVLENGVPRAGREVGPGPIKSIKPYSRPPTADSAKIANDVY